MSGEVAHQEAPATKEAARDLDPTRADEPTAAGAALLAGGPRMLSPAYVTSLQRLAGNAGLASVLQPRPSHAPVVARQEAPDTRAAQWSHGWMAGSLKELAALPPAELAKVEAHAKDPDVDAKRFEIMLTAVRLSKAGGGKDWQLRDLYRQMQGASIPQDQQQEVATFVGAFGLFTPKTINEYVKDVGDIFAGWAELGSTDARAEAFGYLINRQLGYQRVPPVKIVVAGIAGGGEFNKDDWTVTISTRLGALNLTPEQQSDLIRRAAANFLHEARHAEQIFTVARARAGAGSSAETIAKELKIPGDIAGKAYGLKVPPGSPEAKAAAAWYESEFGAGKAHRDAVLGDLDKRHDEYAALPEEADAHALGVAVSDRIQGGVPAPAGAAGGDAGLPGGVQRQPVVSRAMAGAPPRSPAGSATVQRDTLSDQVVAGEFKPVLEYLNGRSMEDMLDRLEKLGFANASYLLANLGAAAWLGPYALARLEAAIRAVGIRQTGTSPDLLIPLVEAVTRSGVRQRSDQFEAVRRKVMPPPGGWGALVAQHLTLAEMGPLLGLTAVGNAFRVLDFVTDGDMNQVLSNLKEPSLRLLIVNSAAADRYDGERIKRALDATWRSRFPLVEVPWPKAPTASSLDVAGMSTMDKLAEAIRRSQKYGGDELVGKLEELLQPQSLAMIAGTVILFAVLEGSTAGAAGVALIALSAAMMGPEVYQVVGDINGFISTAVSAKDEADLDQAGKYFAKAAVTISVDILVAVLLHKPTKAATPKIQAGARATGEFLKTSLGPPGGRSGQLVPALVMGGEGAPRFVQAPPERLTPLDTTGGGSGGPKPPTPAYDQMSLAQLRKLAKTDKAAAEALLDVYRSKSDAELRKFGRDDQTAQAVLRQRTTPNDADLARALGSEYRPPHSASVTVRRGTGEVFRGELTSGNMTPQEAALGYPRNSLATHTEARAVRRPDLQPGDVMTIDGQYDPCTSCRTAMNTAARWLGITIHYMWSGGTITFRP